MCRTAQNLHGRRVGPGHTIRADLLQLPLQLGELRSLSVEFTIAILRQIDTRCFCHAGLVLVSYLMTVLAKLLCDSDQGFKHAVINIHEL